MPPPPPRRPRSNTERSDSIPMSIGVKPEEDVRWRKEANVETSLQNIETGQEADDRGQELHEYEDSGASNFEEVFDVISTKFRYKWKHAPLDTTPISRSLLIPSISAGTFFGIFQF